MNPSESSQPMHRSLVIGLCGGTGSGKTTIANRIIAQPALAGVTKNDCLKVRCQFCRSEKV